MMLLYVLWLGNYGVRHEEDCNSYEVGRLDQNNRSFTTSRWKYMVRKLLPLRGAIECPPSPCGTKLTWGSNGLLTGNKEAPLSEFILENKYRAPHL